VSRRIVAVLAAAVAGLVVATALVATYVDARGPDERHRAHDPGTPPALQRAAVARKLRGEVLDTIGVVSANAFRHLSWAGAKHDWDRLTGNPDVDLIGWQESKSPAFRSLYPRYAAAGWQTWYRPDPDGPISLAVTWRTSTFGLEGVRFVKMHDGGFPRQTTDPFPARWVVVVTLRHRASGRTVTLLNTHVNQHIETGHGFQHNLNARRAHQHLARLATMWGTVPGDVVVGTGDYNFDYADDSRYRPAGGTTQAFAGRALSSYQALGLDGLAPTRNTRWIDYVFLASASVKGHGGTAQFARHRTLTGASSDHDPLLARIRLYR
jgi:endonuclease/exonuclease/phosphatase family metal-dependent hydrolase